MLRNIVIKNGHVIDPANHVDAIDTIYISGDRIVAAKDFTKADIEFDAKGKYIFPGLIDFHAHVFDKSTEIGINPDIAMLCQGVTAVVDAGSAGVSNIQTFVDTIVHHSMTTVQAYLELCPAGQPTMQYHENFDPKYWDLKQISYYLDKYADILLGLKIRMSQPILGELGFQAFEKAVAVARQLHTHICVHTTNPAGSMEQVADVLEKGDILAHCFHGTGDSILGPDGTVKQAVLEAQKRGVIMDAANGGNHWRFSVAVPAMEQGFYPNIISTDLTVKTLFKDPVFGLPYIMSKYLSLGMELPDIVRACTATPAALLAGSERLGTLSAGAQADIAVFDLIDKEVPFSDTAREIRWGHQLLVPLLTLCKGQLVYRNMMY